MTKIIYSFFVLSLLFSLYGCTGTILLHHKDKPRKCKGGMIDTYKLTLNYNIYNYGDFRLKLKFFFKFNILMISFYGITLAAYNDSGTEYSSQGIRYMDTRQLLMDLKMVNAFVCIVKNSNGETRPNTSWKALIDEIKCELMPTD